MRKSFIFPSISLFLTATFSVLLPTTAYSEDGQFFPNWKTGVHCYASSSYSYRHRVFDSSFYALFASKVRDERVDPIPLRFGLYRTHDKDVRPSDEQLKSLCAIVLKGYRAALDSTEAKICKGKVREGNRDVINSEFKGGVLRTFRKDSAAAGSVILENGKCFCGPDNMFGGIPYNYIVKDELIGRKGSDPKGSHD